MTPEDVLPRLTTTSPGMLCRELGRESSKTIYRVPVEHRAFAPPTRKSAKVLRALPALLSTDQLRALHGGFEGLGLFAPTRARADDASASRSTKQMAMGAVLLPPPSRWADEREVYEDWQFDGVDATFRDLPYGIDDLVFFASINFSPDKWFLVLRGPMAGRVCWWTHDGDSVMHLPWANDIADWGRRVWAEVPDLFGGVIRFEAGMTIDAVHPGIELTPERFVEDLNHPDTI